MQKYNQKKIVKLNKNQIKNATQTKYIPKCHVKYSSLLIIRKIVFEVCIQ